MSISTPIEKAYQPETIETKWYKTWEKAHYFAPSGYGEPYCIMLPPPNVTGSLHMGHGFGFTLMDVLIRYKRMQKRNTLWQPGTDHAGIATQMVVERQLNQQGQTRHDLGRSAFLEKVWAWKEESGGTITKQLRRLGASLDWSRERFTMDPDFSHAVKTAFITLYQAGLIYRGKRLVNWDPVLCTAVSDLEVISEPHEGHLWHIRYPLVDHEKEHIIIATTRPETLLGDVAVAVHPEDERYTHLIGKFVHLPLTGREIPIIADSDVDPSFGSGCVKITPAHDFNDYRIGARHGLVPINIFTDKAHINDEMPIAYRGLDREGARKKIVEDLEKLGLLEKIEKHTLPIPRGDRSNAIIEPYLTHQWFLKSSELAKDAIDVVQKQEVRFVPDHWQKTYFQWMNNIEDWCISRQLWWGHRIPVWYDEDGNDYAGYDEEDVRKRYALLPTTLLKQDEDVLDTWFSASLWPFATLGWPNQTDELNTFFKTDVLVTGFDIIFFWVARMMMMSLYFLKQAPFKDIYITGLIRDAEGHKMSKSKGNVLDPIDLIDGIDLEKLVAKRTQGLMQPQMAEKIAKHTRGEFPEGIPAYGTDALRLTFCSLASYTREIRFDMKRLGGYKNFCNKLWNAARYVEMNLGEHTHFIDAPIDEKLSLPDRYIISKLQQTIAAAHEHFEAYRFDLLTQAIYEFTWNDFCDWYLELSKPILLQKNADAEALYATRHTLIHTLDAILCLLHPLAPYITEEIWQRFKPQLGNEEASIMLADYPKSNANKIDSNSLVTCYFVQKVVTGIRQIRSEKNIPPGRAMELWHRAGSAEENHILLANAAFLERLCKLSSIRSVQADDRLEMTASLFIGELELFVPLHDLIDKGAELKRITQELKTIEQDLARISAKLENPQFIERAPEEIILKEKSKLSELSLKKTKLLHQQSLL